MILFRCPEGIQQVTLGCCEFLQPEADPVIFLERAMTTLSSTKVLSHQILSLFLKFFIFNPSLLNSLTYNVYCPPLGDVGLQFYSDNQSILTGRTY
jgi:hypothetical protein